MDFSARDDIEAPIEYVFDQVTDFNSFERSIMRRGGDVEWLAGGDKPAVGTKWGVNFRFRGKDRTVNAEITSVERPNGLTINVVSKNLTAIMVVELVALSRARTRLNVNISATAKSIPAKLLFQSMRFARQKTDARFKTMVAGYAEDIETRYRS